MAERDRTEASSPASASPTCLPSSPFPSPLWPSRLDSFGQGLSGFIGFGIAVWTIVLSVFAIQANNNLSTGRAILAIFLPLAIFLILFITLFAYVVVMILIALNEGFSQ